MLSGARIENLVIGGPAFVSGQLDRDDEILRVDGIECETIEGLHLLLRGSDIPGSSLLLTVKKASTVSARLGSCLGVTAFAKAQTGMRLMPLFLVCANDRDMLKTCSCYAWRQHTYRIEDNFLSCLLLSRTGPVVCTSYLRHCEPGNSHQAQLMNFCCRIQRLETTFHPTSSTKPLGWCATSCSVEPTSIARINVRGVLTWHVEISVDQNESSRTRQRRDHYA